MLTIFILYLYIPAPIASITFAAAQPAQVAGIQVPLFS